MKAIHSLAAAVALVTLLPAVGQAQNQTRPFQNSWFWGIKAGGTLVGSPGNSNVTSPMVGADWLITRDKGGVYVSFDQSFLTKYAVIADSVNAGDTNSQLRLSSLRRLTVLLMAYPGSNPTLHPYAGLGLVMSKVSAAPTAAYTSQGQANLASTIIRQYDVVFSPGLLLGVQADHGNTGLFVQAMGWQANSQFFLYSGRGYNVSLEVGVRYNFSTSISSNDR